MKKLLIYAIGLLLISCGGSDSGTVTPPAPTPPAAEQPISGKFTKNVLIEDYTGTWCGYCPRVSYGIQKVEEAAINAVPVAIHRGSTSSSSSSYDPFNFNASQLETMIGLTGYPTAKLNRLTTWTYPEPNNVAQVKNLTGPNSNVGLAMNSTVANGTINLAVKMKFAANYTNLKLVVYALEDDLIFNQTNYTTYYGGGSVINNFEHDHVLRACFTDLFGDVVAGTNDGAEVIKNFTVAVPANVTNVAKMSFVAFVVDGSNTALNVRSATPGQNQAYQQNP